MNMAVDNDYNEFQSKSTMSIDKFTSVMVTVTCLLFVFVAFLKNNFGSVHYVPLLLLLYSRLFVL